MIMIKSTYHDLSHTATTLHTTCKNAKTKTKFSWPINTHSIAVSQLTLTAGVLNCQATAKSSEKAEDDDFAGAVLCCKR